MGADAEFDQYAQDYDALVNRSLALSGEEKHYFTRRRVTFLAGQLARLQVLPGSVLDFGCGTGGATPALLGQLGAQRVIGVDPSAKSIEVARQSNAGASAEFHLPADRPPVGDIDVAYCNGVFHHISIPERADAARYVYESLRPGGVFAFWEHNPWNPGTRWSMHRCPFDQDAITLTPGQARRLLRDAGFQVLRTNFLFIFPRRLAWLRRLERFATRLPIGAQYEVLCVK